MEYNLLTNIEQCHSLIADTVPLGMVLYSHVPTAFIALLLGFFVFFKSSNLLAARVLLALSVSFSLWLFGDLIVWVANYNSVLTMFAWSMLAPLNIAFFILSLYFVYVYIDKEDISWKMKSFLGLLLLPVLVVAPTSMNLSGFTMEACEAIENDVFLNYLLCVQIFISAWIIWFSIHRYRAADRVVRRQIKLLSVGINLFLISFFTASYIASYLDNFDYELYGLFGMTVFMGFLAYLIVTFRAFDVKLLQAQALVSAMAILIGSQFFFVHNPINRVLTAVTLALVAVFGWWLVRSVRREDEQRDKLEEAYLRLNQDKVSLERMNKELQTLDQAKSEFINIASHQLRTPVTVIRGVVSLLRDGSMDDFSPEKKKQFYESAWTKCEKLEDIIDDVLNATSLINRKYSAMDKDVEPIDLKAFLQRMIADFETETRERELSLVLVRYDETLPPLYAQKQYLEEVFSNLLTNAIKYTPSPKKTTDVRGIRDDKEARIEIQAVKDGDCVIVSVRDNGIGIPVEAMPKLFQKFSRAENATNMYTDGSGLGLFIVKEIVEGHGGSVWVESELNKGSTFFVKLPLHREEKVDVKQHIMEHVAAE